MRAKALLKKPRPARMVGVSMADQHVLDLGRIQAKLPQAADDFVFHRVAEDGVDNDDAGRGRDGPGRSLPPPKKIEFVDPFAGSDAPAQPVRSSGPLPAPPL